MFNKKKSKKIDYDEVEKNSEYLINIQKFLDIADNIKDEDLKRRIIYQHFACERIIKKFFENESFNE